MIQILIVDDVEQWRIEIREHLNGHTNSFVISEASTGFEAIEVAARVKPDIILLDIGLPDLNGVQVAKRIRDVAPSAKIIFVTLNDDANSARELVRDQAYGYVLKANLHDELPMALDRVTSGGRFISAQLVN